MRSSFLLSVWTALVMISLSVSAVTGGSMEQYGELIVMEGMHVPRYNHTATLHPVDRGSMETMGSLVYVTGGTTDGHNSISSVEVYHEGKWSSAASMNEPRMRHAAVNTGDRLMVTGGYVGGGHPSLFRHYNGTGNSSLSSCEIHRPGSEIWTYTAPMKVGRFWHGILAIDNREVLVIGGLNTTEGALSSCEVYNIEKDEWRDFPSLPIPLARFAYGMDPEGNIIVAGGHDGIEKKALDRVFVFRNGSDSWEEVASMKHPRGYPGFCFIDGGRFVVSGGFSSPGEPDRSDTEVYDISMDTWEGYGEMQYPRHGHVAHHIDGVGIIIAGGSNCQTGGCHSNMEIYIEEEDTWKDTGHLITARKWGAATPTYKGTILMTGGLACNYATNNTEEYIFFSPGSDTEDADKRSKDLMVIWLIILGPVTVLIILLLYSKRRE